MNGNCIENGNSRSHGLQVHNSIDTSLSPSSLFIHFKTQLT
jgi:hypothetical protein